MGILVSGFIVDLKDPHLGTPNYGVFFILGPRKLFWFAQNITFLEINKKLNKISPLHGEKIPTQSRVSLIVTLLLVLYTVN